MAKLSIKAGSTDVTVYFRVFAYTASNIPQPKTGLVYSGFTTYYCRQRGAATQITMATQTDTGAHSDGGLVQVSATNMPGIYRFDLPDAVCATGSPYAIVTLRHSTNTNSAIDLEIELTGWDNQDGVRGGMTALPNAAAAASGGLFIRGTGAGAINQDANGRIDVNVEAWNATAVPSEHTAGYPIVTVKDGTGTGEIDTASGAVVQVNQLGTQAKADVNAEVLDVLNTDTFAEPGQEAPGATVSLVKKIGYLYKAWRNKKTQTSSQYSLFNDDAATVDHKSTVSDDGTTTTIGEVATGP